MVFDWQGTGTVESCRRKMNLSPPGSRVKTPKVHRLLPS